MSSEWRCTFPDRYPENSPGHHDMSARQGTYVKAENSMEAELKVRATGSVFPDEEIDIEFWKAA